MVSLEDFDLYLESVHGHAPFPWQRALARSVSRHGRWPTLLDLPTGSGKTTAIDIAVFTLALAARSDAAVPPRRIVYVVDRRTVVDQAFEHAHRLAQRLAHPDDEPGGPLEQARRRVRDSLRGLGSERPLRVSLQRGGIPRDDLWATRPDQPTVLVSTVDQVGSRLLFRGYGLTPRMQPIHAGLLGMDCVFLLDEVHLSRAFAETLAQIAGTLRDRGEPVFDRARWQVVEMSATPGRRATQAFSLGDDDRDPDQAERLVRRLTARKHARLIEVEAGPVAKVLPPAVAKVLKHARGAAKAVVVNRVATARAIAVDLQSRGHAVELLTGRMRQLDRRDRYDGVKDRIAAGRSRSPDAAPLVVVATQSIEAGADLDFDWMATECAPIDSLRQRFGRLDRLGDLAATSGPAEAAVFAPRSAVAGREDDPVYGAAVQAAYRLLKDRHGEEVFDVGPETSDLADPPAAACSPAKGGPLLLAPHLDVLVQTHPRPHIDQPVSPWLHGFDDVDTDVSVIWRADLTPGQLARERRDAELDRDQEGEERLATRVVAACPPSSLEAMQLPVSAVRAWLRGHEQTPTSDVEGMPAADGSGADAADARLALRWLGPEDSTVVAPGDIQPGDSLVVPASYGGVSLHNWDPASVDAVTDLAERAQWESRRIATLRLHPNILPGDLKPPDGLTPDTDRDEADALLSDWLATVRVASATPAWQQLVVAQLLASLSRRLQRTWMPDGEGGSFLVLSARGAGSVQAAADVDDLDGSDVTNSFIGAGHEVTLDEHLAGVGRIAEEFATRCGFSPALAADVRLAGELHDLGKADARFQQWLHNGDEIAALSAAGLLAKSSKGADDPVARERARRLSGYPRDARHELLSVALAERTPVLAGAHDADLVLHLVATHHGYCRACPPPGVDPQDLAVRADLDRATFSGHTRHGLERMSSGVTERFWALTRRYGWWGLAYLETVLRLADHRRSQLERRV